MVAGMTIANLAGVPLASFLAWAVSWRAAFAIAAAAALITFAAIRITVPLKCRHCPTADLPHNSDSCAVRSHGSCFGAIGLGNGGFFRLLFICQSRHGTRSRGSGFDDVRRHHARRCRHGAWEPLLRQNFIVLSDESLAAAGQGVLLLSLASVFFSRALSPAAIALTTLRRWLRIFHFRPRTGPDDPQRQRRPAACRITRSGIFQRRQRRRCVARRIAHRCGQSRKLGGHAGIFPGARGFSAFAVTKIATA